MYGPIIQRLMHGSSTKEKAWNAVPVPVADRLSASVKQVSTTKEVVQQCVTQFS